MPRSLALAGACLIAAIALALLQPQPGAAASLVAKDGKIHACYKAKGKGKGALRVVRGAKAKCPKGWRKTAWVASPVSSGAAVGPVGPKGEQGPAGQAGPQGSTGATGRSENVVVDELESKVTELLTKVQSLEAVLAGVDNAELKEAIEGIAKVDALEAVLSGVTHSQLIEAIGLSPTVGALCEQTEELTGQTTALGSTLGALNTILGGFLGVLFTPPTIPTALPPFSCPSP
jgi:hypothetical protein